MRRFLDTRLARMARTEAPRELMEARRRSLLRGRAALSALLSKQLEIGPALAGVLQFGDTAAATLAGIPDTDELRESDEALLAYDHAGAEDTFGTRLWHVVRQYRDGRDPDPANASPAEWVAAYAAKASVSSTLPSPQAGER
jgi:hypothetical protein